MSGPAIGSLFSGYGGLDLAVQSVLGGQVAWHCENDPAPSRVLAANWPGVPNHGDITAIDWAGVTPVDILTGGFPCQDVSHAGRRAGLGPGTRTGLWSRMADAIDHLRPRLVVAENVRGLLSARADSDVEPCPWCLGDPGDGEPALRALGAVLADLADLGYDAVWHGLRAADIGAPHGRFRVFVLAWPAAGHPTDVVLEWSGPVRGWRAGTPGPTGGTGGSTATDADGAARGEWRLSAPGQAEGGRACPDVGGRDRASAAHPDGDAIRQQPVPEPGRGGPAVAGLARPYAPADTQGRGAQVQREHQERPRQPHADQRTSWGAYEPAVRRWERTLGRPAPAPTEPGRGGNGRLSPRFVEWMMGLSDGWVCDVPGISRNDQLRMLGNGVVPQQAQAALRVLLDHLAGAAA